MKSSSKIGPIGPETEDHLVILNNERAIIDPQLWLALDINSNAPP
jgi:hypothetical protein